MAMRRVHLFTVNELREKLDDLVKADPGLGETRVLMDGLDQYESWDGTFEYSKGLQALILCSYADLWIEETPAEPGREGAL